MSNPRPINNLALSNWRSRALTVSAIAIVLLLFGFFTHREHFFRAYLTAWLYCLGIALGAMAFVMLHHLVGGEWGYLIRRIGESAALTIPLLAVLFIPIALGFAHLYPWARPDEVAHEEILQHRRLLFNPQFILIRAAIYFAIWTLCAWRLRSLSLQSDKSPNPRINVRLERFSAAGLVVYFITMSLASVDWIASREVNWYSSVFGLLTIVGQAVTGLTFILVILRVLSKTSPMREAAQPNRLHDLGNLLLTVVVLWAYISFAQFLVIWIGNTQDDNIWFIHRNTGVWLIAGIGLIVLHFAVPFFLLLIQQAKRRIEVLATIAGVVLVLRYVDVLWTVAPSNNSPAPAPLSWMDFIAPIGVGGIWLSTFIWILNRQPLLANSNLSPASVVNHGPEGTAKPA